MRRFVIAVATTTLGVLIAISAVVYVLDRSVSPQPVTEACHAEVSGSRWLLDTEQAANAALIAIYPLAHGMPARAATIGLATAYQESRIRNIDYGDRDSVGLFQQRPSQGWGKVKQIMNPAYATAKFYQALNKVANYTELTITQAAQAVQRSAYPDAYAQHEDMARAWASSLHGYEQDAISCTLTPVTMQTQAVTARDSLVASLVAQIPPAESTLSTSGRQVRLSAKQLTAQLGLAKGQRARVGWALANWAVAIASSHDVDAVQFRSMMWTRQTGTWVLVDSEVPDVTITLGGTLDESAQPDSTD